MVAVEIFLLLQLPLRAAEEGDESYLAREHVRNDQLALKGNEGERNEVQDVNVGAKFVLLLSSERRKGEEGEGGDEDEVEDEDEKEDETLWTWPCFFSTNMMFSSRIP